MSGPRSRYWCFTLNNYDLEDEADIQAARNLQYLVYGREVGENGTPHLQGYIEFTDRVRMATIKNRTNCQEMHLEVAKGNAAQNRVYCTKQGSYHEEGIPENKVVTLMSMIQTGAQDMEIYEAFPNQFIKNHAGISRAKKLYLPDRNWIMDIELYMGSSGTGKTVAAWKYWYEKKESIFEVNLQSNFPMDGYDGEEIILLDEFRSQLPFGFLLKLLDSKPLKLNIKYGSTKIQATRIIITSNQWPWEWYPKINDKSMLYRRINEWAEIYEFIDKDLAPVLRLGEIDDGGFKLVPYLESEGGEPDTMEDEEPEETPPAPTGQGPTEEIFQNNQLVLPDIDSGEESEDLDEALQKDYEAFIQTQMDNNMLNDGKGPKRDKGEFRKM